MAVKSPQKTLHFTAVLHSVWIWPIVFLSSLNSAEFSLSAEVAQDSMSKCHSSEMGQEEAMEAFFNFNLDLNSYLHFLFIYQVRAYCNTTVP